MESLFQVNATDGALAVLHDIKSVALSLTGESLTLSDGHR